MLLNAYISLVTCHGRDSPSHGDTHIDTRSVRLAKSQCPTREDSPIEHLASPALDIVDEYLPKETDTDVPEGTRVF